jgi:3-hydroxyacyl-CoA dehydrogenase
LDQLIQVWTGLLGTAPPIPPIGPFPTYDCFGVIAVVAMLMKSLNPGHNQDYTQFELMQKLCPPFSNLFHASALGSTSMMTLGRDTA